MRCRGLQGFANTAYLEGFPFPGLLSVAPYRAPGGIRVVSVGRAGCDNFTLPCHFKFLSPLFACFDLLVCRVAHREFEAQGKARTYSLSCDRDCPCSTTSSLTCSRPTSSSSISRHWILP